MRRAVRFRRALGGQARGAWLESQPDLREPGEIPHVDARDEHSAPRVHLYEALTRERPKRLSHRCPSEFQAQHQVALADERPRRELEGHDQLADAVVGLIRERRRICRLGLVNGERGCVHRRRLPGGGRDAPAA